MRGREKERKGEGEGGREREQEKERETPRAIEKVEVDRAAAKTIQVVYGAWCKPNH